MIFFDGLTKSHVKELLFFKDMELPDYLKFFYQQTNGLQIESKYFLDEFNDPSQLLIHSLENLSFAKEKLHKLPEKRFITFGTNDDESEYLIDLGNLSPIGNPLIILSLPVFKRYIPLTSNFDVFLESACLGLLGVIEAFGCEKSVLKSDMPKKMIRKKERILFCLKEIFDTTKREYQLLDLWHLPLTTKQLVSLSFVNWFKELKSLLGIFQ